MSDGGGLLIQRQLLQVLQCVYHNTVYDIA